MRAINHRRYPCGYPCGNPRAKPENPGCLLSAKSPCGSVAVARAISSDPGLTKEKKMQTPQAEAQIPARRRPRGPIPDSAAIGNRGFRESPILGESGIGDSGPPRFPAKSEIGVTGNGDFAVCRPPSLSVPTRTGSISAFGVRTARRLQMRFQGCIQRQ